VPRPRLLLVPLVVFLLGGAAAPAMAASPRLAGGSSPAAIDQAVDAYRNDVAASSDNEVTWEEADLPDAPLSNPFTYRNLTLTSAGSGFQIMASPDAYSPQNLLDSGGGNVTADFVVSSSNTSGVSRGLGVVLLNVSAGSTKVELLGASGQTLASAPAPTGQYSFVGLTTTNWRVVRVRITVGSAQLDNVIFDRPEPDPDRDGIPSAQDNCPTTSNPGQENVDKDAQGNVCDDDADNDHIPNSRDAFPLDKSESTDTDGDGIGDNKDADDDNDGLTDVVEGRLGTDPKNRDTDGDGAIDGQDNCPAISNPTQTDADGDGRGDACADRVAPVLSRLALRPATFRRGSKNGSLLTFRLSEQAAVRFTAEHLVIGHRVGAGCARGLPRRSRHELACRVYAPVRGTMTRNGTSGTNFVKFPGRFGGRWMKPGRYRLTATGADLAGNPTAKAVRATFTILP
jgi:hypothetical protein